jgi:recombination protein RecT
MMTTQALKNAINSEPAQTLSEMKPKDRVVHLLDLKKAAIQKLIPPHLKPERLLKVAQIAATTTPKLLECNIASLIGAIGQCAQMGLEPNTVLGHAYLVPFKGSVQVIIGYKGLIDLARRSGQIVSIAAHEVCENDAFACIYGLNEKLEHTPSMNGRGEIIAFYAVAKLKDGGHAFEVMSRQQVEAIRDASSGWQQAVKYNKQKNHPWETHFIEMGRKTAIRRLAKYLPLSVEFQTAAVLDGLAEAGKDQRLDAIDGDVTLMPEDAPEAQMWDAALDAQSGAQEAHRAEDAPAEQKAA